MIHVLMQDARDNDIVAPLDVEDRMLAYVHATEARGDIILRPASFRTLHQFRERLENEIAMGAGLFRAPSSSRITFDLTKIVPRVVRDDQSLHRSSKKAASSCSLLMIVH